MMDAGEQVFLSFASAYSHKYPDVSVGKIAENALPTMNCRKRILHDGSENDPFIEMYMGSTAAEYGTIQIHGIKKGCSFEQPFDLIGID